MAMVDASKRRREDADHHKDTACDDHGLPEAHRAASKHIRVEDDRREERNRGLDRVISRELENNPVGSLRRQLIRRAFPRHHLAYPFHEVRRAIRILDRLQPLRTRAKAGEGENWHSGEMRRSQAPLLSKESVGRHRNNTKR